MPEDGGQPKLNAFVDHGFSDPRAFATFFFESPEFSIRALRNLVGSWSRAKKSDYASELWSRLDSGTISPDRIVREWVSQPRRWLSLKLGRPDRLTYSQSPIPLLTFFGEDGWYGPVRDQENNPRWFLRTVTVPHFRFVDNEPVRSRIRWTVIAEVSDRYLGLSWNNFTHRELDELGGSTQFPFWQHISPLFEELKQEIGGEWQHPLLHKLVLEDLWDRYVAAPGFSWQHLRIRAERSGVALNARSSGVRDLNVRGLETLTRRLAESASASVGIPREEDIQKMDKALLRTVIREWGTNSYEFRLDQLRSNGTPRTLFRAHCYFGLRPTLNTEDALQHLRCSLANGGSRHAQEFLLEHLLARGS